MSDDFQAACFSCNRAVSFETHFCHGCQAVVCSDCDQNSDVPMGRHDRAEHLEGGWLEAYEARYQRRKMCQQCPFNKDGPGGYIGPYKDAEEILELVHGEGRFPCHTEANETVARHLGEAGAYDERVAQEVYPQARQCAGAMQFLKAVHKRPREPAYARALDEIVIEDSCVKNPHEYLNHHRDGINLPQIEKRSRARKKKS